MENKKPKQKPQVSGRLTDEGFEVYNPEEVEIVPNKKPEPVAASAAEPVTLKSFQIVKDK